LLVGVENGNGDMDRDGPVSFWVSFYLCPSVLFPCFYHAENRDTAHFFNLLHCRPAAHKFPVITNTRQISLKPRISSTMYIAYPAITPLLSITSRNSEVIATLYLVSVYSLRPLLVTHPLITAHTPLTKQA
jgi:hypothetical protein